MIEESNKNNIFLAMMTWNAGQGHLEESIDSILNQSYQDFSLLIYDDCSPNEPSSRIEPYLLKDKRVKYIKSDERRGMCDASSYVLGLAPDNTTFFAWVSDHDLYDPEWLYENISNLNANISSMLSYSLVSGIDTSGASNERKPTIYENTTMSRYKRISSLAHLEAGAGNMIWGIYRYKSLIKVGGWPKLVIPDVILLLRLSLFGSVAQVDKYLHIRREQSERALHSGSMAERQLRAIFPTTRPFYTLVSYQIINSLYLLRQAIYYKKNGALFLPSFYIWFMYTYVNIKFFLFGVPKRIFNNRFTRFLASKLSNEK